MPLQNFKLPDHLKFDPDAGVIEFAGGRVMLFNERAVNILISVLSEQTGLSMSRMMLAKFGYESAVQDYKALTDLLPGLTESERLAIGPLMHSWSGIVNVRPEIMEIDQDSGKFHFKGRWYNSYEAAAYLRTHGRGDTPVCFSLTGYGSGWCTTYFGKPLLEIETKCVACGDDYCEWEIRPWDEWGPEADLWKQSLSKTSRSIHADLEKSLSDLRDLNENLEDEVERRTIENREQLRTLCHDLDAPIQLAISDLRSAAFNGTGESVERALRLLNSADRMICRAREVQAVSEGKRTTRLEVFNLADIVRETLDLMGARLNAKSLHVGNDVPRDINVVADRDILRDHVLVNILSNAVKFSSRGSLIAISAERFENGNVSLSVKDEGIGIPRDLLAMIFDPKSASSRAGTDGEKGTGYGVPLMKSHMLRMGGDISITSKTMSDDPFDHGTTVTCVFIP